MLRIKAVDTRQFQAFVRRPSIHLPSKYAVKLKNRTPLSRTSGKTVTKPRRLRNLARGFLGDGETRPVNAVVIGDENAHSCVVEVVFIQS